MTKPLFFDTDCLSAFLWVNNQNILVQLYPGRVIIPQAVYDELSNPRVDHLKQRIDTLIGANEVSIETITIDTEEYELYRKMTSNSQQGRKAIGSGEAATIALAKVNNGIIASNNLRDVREYVEEYQLPHVTTGDVLVEALEKGIITEAQGNKIWMDMIKRKRKLGANSFSEYLSIKNREI